MEITCKHCQTKLSVPDNKLPQNQLVRLQCPKCKNKVSLDTRPKEDAEKPRDETHAETGKLHLQSIESQNPEEEQEEKYSYDDYSSDESLLFVEEDAKLALAMPRDGEQAESIKTAVEELGYQYVASTDTRDALGKLRFHQFDVILLSEGFDNQGLEANGIITYLNHIPISLRRKTYFVLIGDQFKTMDDMMAFALSANLVINANDLAKAAKVLKRGITDFQKFYKVFMDTLIEVGKA
jgi:predicted Zn finger-like uncharacterized protein